MNVSEFVLKATPPRMPGATLERAHLLHERRHECTALLVIAPAGFGKTTVLLQWRRDGLAAGAPVAWCAASDTDRPARFLFVKLSAGSRHHAVERARMLGLLP